MKLYLDTSALVKLYVEEEGTALVKKAVEDADIVATSLVAYVEARAAFARRRREGILLVADHSRVLRNFENEWRRFVVIDVTVPLVRNAATFAELFALRGFDAIHLAAAEFFRVEIGESVSFGCWDARLEAAARRQGLQLLRARLQ